MASPDEAFWLKRSRGDSGDADLSEGSAEESAQHPLEPRPAVWQVDADIGVEQDRHSRLTGLGSWVLAALDGTFEVLQYLEEIVERVPFRQE